MSISWGGGKYPKLPWLYKHKQGSSLEAINITYVDDMQIVARIEMGAKA